MNRFAQCQSQMRIKFIFVAGGKWKEMSLPQRSEMVCAKLLAKTRWQ